MDDRERATVLAALRHWQRTRERCFEGALTQAMLDLNDILTDGGKLEALTNEEIDELCERINVDIEASSEASL